MKEQLITLVQSQLGDIKSADTKELGEAIDMIKDLSESIYYCTITEAMGENAEEKYKDKEKYRSYVPKQERRYYPIRPYSDEPKMYSHDEYWDDDYWKHRPEPYYYREYEYPKDITRRDPKEGRSPLSRRMYMEAKELHKDSNKKMQELETYIQELTSDLIEIIADATPEEKQLLKTKISTLSTKIV